jgi:hypothetical protein
MLPRATLRVARSLFINATKLKYHTSHVHPSADCSASECASVRLVHIPVQAPRLESAYIPGSPCAHINSPKGLAGRQGTAAPHLTGYKRPPACSYHLQPSSQLGILLSAHKQITMFSHLYNLIVLSLTMSSVVLANPLADPAISGSISRRQSHSGT